MRRMTGAGPTLVLESSANVVMWMCSSGVEARETATQEVVGAIPEAMRSWASASKSRPGM